MTRRSSLSVRTDDQSILIIAQLSTGTRRINDDSVPVQHNSSSSTNTIDRDSPNRSLRIGAITPFAETGVLRNFGTQAPLETKARKTRKAVVHLCSSHALVANTRLTWRKNL